jgi:hypothetical protein
LSVILRPFTPPAAFAKLKYAVMAALIFE